jgi:DNA-directed RNA polymerase specialized sigma subunit
VSTGLSSIARVRRQIAAAEVQMQKLLEQRRKLIRAALAGGRTRTAIAAEAGVSRQRVVQIEEGRAR